MNVILQALLYGSGGTEIHIEREDGYVTGGRLNVDLIGNEALFMHD